MEGREKKNSKMGPVGTEYISNQRIGAGRRWFYYRQAKLEKDLRLLSLPLLFLQMILMRARQKERGGESSKFYTAYNMVPSFFSANTLKREVRNIFRTSSAQVFSEIIVYILSLSTLASFLKWIFCGISILSISILSSIKFFRELTSSLTVRFTFKVTVSSLSSFPKGWKTPYCDNLVNFITSKPHSWKQTSLTSHRNLR